MAKLIQKVIPGAMNRKSQSFLDISSGENVGHSAESRPESPECTGMEFEVSGEMSADASVLARQNRELVILNRIATALNESINLADSLQAALSMVGELLGLETGWVWLLEDGDGEPYLAASMNLPPGLADDPSAMEGSCMCLDAFVEGGVQRAANISVVKCSRLRHLSNGSAGLRFHASIPIQARARRLGLMNVASSEMRKLSPEELRLLHTIGDMLGVATERARLYARSVEAGAMEERSRLARELHDTIAQQLAATALQLETAEALLESSGDAEPVRQAIRHALDTMRFSLDETRRSVLDLRAAPLQGRSLAEALHEICEATGCDGRPRIRVDVTGKGRPIPSRIEVALFRVAQEALTNARKHSRADSVHVRLTVDATSVTLCVEDDGDGFDLLDVASERFGLVGMRERIRLLGGQLLLDSRPGHGTRVEARIDLP